MKLDTYIRQSGVTETQIARRANLSQSVVNRVRNGTCNPTYATLLAISEATDGEFTPADFRPKGSLELEEDGAAA